MKIENKVKLCSTVSMCLFLYQVHKARISICRNKLKKTQVHLLCKKFAKQILHSNRMRLSHKARCKQAIHKTTNVITSSLHGKAIENAENKIGQYFKRIFVKKAISNACAKA